MNTAYVDVDPNQDTTDEERTPENWADTEKYCADRAGEVQTMTGKAPSLRKRLENAPGRLEDLQLIGNLEVDLLEKNIGERRRREAAGGGSPPSDQGSSGNMNAFSRFRLPSLRYFQSSLTQAFPSDRRTPSGWSQAKAGPAPRLAGGLVRPR